MEVSETSQSKEKLVKLNIGDTASVAYFALGNMSLKENRSGDITTADSRFSKRRMVRIITLLYSFLLIFKNCINPRIRLRPKQT